MRLVNIGGWGFFSDVTQGIGPYFTNIVRWRVKTRRACNIAVTGEAGIGKTYMGTDICRILESRFTVGEVVYTFPEYMDCLMGLKLGWPMCFDEPQYAIGKRDWYKEVNQALVNTIQSQRFMVHPLVICIINLSLLDKILRTYLIQYHIVVRDRGRAAVYVLSPSPHQDKVYSSKLCDLIYPLWDNDKCDRMTCLDCGKIEDCQIFRAQYERKKRKTQLSRYEQERELASKRETERLTIGQIAEKAIENRDLFTNKDGLIDVNAMTVTLQEQCGIDLSHVRSYRLRALLVQTRPDLFKKRDA